MKAKRIFLNLLIIVSIIIGIKNVQAAININQTSMNIGINYSKKLTISGDTTGNITWYSSNPNIVTVNDGTITGISIGTAYVTISNGDSTDSCKITVIDNYIPISNIILSKSNTTISIGEKSKIPVTLSPSNTSNKDIFYSSSNNNIISVDNDGYITGKKAGTAYISISAEDKSASYKVTVTDKVPLKGISLPTTINMEENSSTKLTITYNPTNATTKTITWKSSDSNIVTVDNNGNLKAKSSGTATITAITTDGGYTASTKVTVSKVDKSLKNIEITPNNLTLEVGQSKELTITYNPANASNKKITWSSTNERIVTVENGKITAIKPGTAEIQVTSEDGEDQATCKVTVTSLPIEKISFTEQEITVYIQTTTALTTISTPENTAINNPIWESSDETVATVDYGTITALSVGTTTITVSDETGEITASIIVNVIEKPEEKLTITIENYQLNFDPDVKNYTLSINNEDSLNIQVNRDDSKVIIGGNKDLKNGSIITITINDNNKVTYVINIQKKGDYTFHFIIIISILLFINIIRIIAKNKKKK